MSSYLLDTHVMLWLANDSELLTDRVKDAFLDDNNSFFLSIASVWEMAIKMSLNKLSLSCTLDTFIDDHVRSNNISVAQIKAHHCYMVQNLPYYHRDPFDRIIIAQAIQENLTLISKDSAIRKYDVDSFW